MTKKILAWVVLLVLVVSVGGCAASKKEEKGTETKESDSQEVGTKEPVQVDIPLPAGGNVKAEVVADEELRIAFLSFQNNPFWNAIKEGNLEAGKYLENYNTQVDYIVMGEELTSAKVTAAIDAAITKEYDAIVVVPIFDGVEVFTDKAIDAGIAVGNYCAEGPNPGNRMFFYGQNGYAAGQLAGELLQQHTDSVGKVGVITGVFGAPIHDARMNGALDYLKENCPDIEIVGPFENKDKGETAYSQTMDMLTANPELKMVYVTAGGPFGAAKAIQDLGLTGEVGVIAYDHIPDNLDYVKSGEILGLINQDPFGQGFDTVVIMHNYLTTGKKPESTFIEAALDVVTPDDVGEFYPRYK